MSDKPDRPISPGKTPSITVFFPCLNDAGTIASMIVLALRTLRNLTDNFEIMVINDGSTDASREVLEELTRFHQNIKIIDHGQNLGYGSALRAGFKNASKELIFYTDGDAQYDVRELSLLLEAMNRQTDFVNGYKISRGDPLHRRIIGRIYHWIVRISFNIKLKDIDCDFRLIRRTVFERVELKSSTGIICVELMKKVQNAGFQIKEVPVHHYHRAYGKSQFFNFRRLVQVGIGLIKLWWDLAIVNKKTNHLN